MFSVASNPGMVRSEDRPEAFPLSRYVPLAVWLGALITLIWIPLKIISYGYLPPDDALRHAAKAVAQKEWSDILVLRPDFQTDHNPGWHWVLGQVHQLGQLGPDGLVTLSVVGLFVLALLLPIALTDRPEAWIGALLVATIAFPAVIHRVLLGRPFALTMAATLLILMLWTRKEQEKPKPGLLALTTGLLALSAWIHGGWYLFSLVIAAFFLSGRTGSALRLTGCWLVGSLLGAVLTGHPFSFLANAVKIVVTCFQDAPLQRMLVLEFLPSGGNVVAIFAVAALLLWRRVSGHWTTQCLRHPAFILAVLGWLLGLRVARFEADWAAPALLLWVALELREHLKRWLPFDSTRRLVISAGLCLALLLATTADENSRWTRALDIEFLSAADPEMAPWLPEKDGVLYAWDMAVFYQTFFRNPHAPWRYMLGFEPTFMPPEDLAIYRNIQRNFGAYTAFEPWVRKMRLEDRLVVRSGPGSEPNIAGLEWHYTARDLWVGRKPRPQLGPVPASPEAAGAAVPNLESLKATP